MQRRSETATESSAVLANDVRPDDVREEREGGTSWLVTPVVFLRSDVRLDKGRVPADHLEAATDDWEGVPIVTAHPRDAYGDLISVNDHRAEVTPFGEIRDPVTVEGEEKTVTGGEAWLNIAQAHRAGGDPRAVVDAVRQGEVLSVSSSYRGRKLGRDEMGHLTPDHVAVFPEDGPSGKCSIDDGCMAGPDASTELAANATNPRDAAEFPALSVGERLEQKRVAANDPADCGCEACAADDDHDHGDDHGGDETAAAANDDGEGFPSLQVGGRLRQLGRDPDSGDGGDRDRDRGRGRRPRRGSR